LSPVDPSYDFNKYLPEIKKALSSFGKAHVGYKDLLQAVDMEVWKASKHYGDGMNPALAYTVAKNTKNKFIKDLIEHPGGLTGEGAPSAVVKPLVVENSQGQEFIPSDGKDIRDTSEEAESQRAWLDRNITSLRILVNRWYGTKKKVALAMLKPGFNARSVEGVPKSTVADIQKVIWVEFRKYVQSLQ